MKTVEIFGSFAPAMTGFAVDMATLPDEWFDNPARGSVTWRTLVDGSRTPTSGMVAGIASFGPGGTLEPHRHAHPELYFGLEGAGTVTVDGTTHRIAPGVAVYLPSDAEHATVAGDEGLKFLYFFAADRFDEIEYRFSRDSAACMNSG